jgi:hypothetical protein
MMVGWTADLLATMVCQMVDQSALLMADQTALKWAAEKAVKKALPMVREMEH